MCEICRQSPCHPQCPNAPDPPTVYTCKSCGEPIVVGDEYYEFDGDYYHEECFEDNATAILVEQCGASRGTAEEDEYYGYDD